LSVGPTGPNRKAYFGKVSLAINFVVLIRVAYGSGSLTPGNRSRNQKTIWILTDPESQWYKDNLKAAAKIQITNYAMHGCCIQRLFLEYFNIFIISPVAYS
jgi:hypothetical protein